MLRRILGMLLLSLSNAAHHVLSDYGMHGYHHPFGWAAMALGGIAGFLIIADPKHKEGK